MDSPKPPLLKWTLPLAYLMLQPTNSPNIFNQLLIAQWQCPLYKRTVPRSNPGINMTISKFHPNISINWGLYKMLQVLYVRMAKSMLSLVSFHDLVMYKPWPGRGKMQGNFIVRMADMTKPALNLTWKQAKWRSPTDREIQLHST